MSKVELKVDWATHEAAKYAVLKWHYSKIMPRNKLVKIGVWENGVFVGVVIFGPGASDALGKQHGLEPFEVCELVRIALSSHSSTVTRIVSLCFNFLKKHCPRIRLVISFADPSQGHHGGIYQAGNWIYTGKTQESDEYTIHGKKMHGRAVRKTLEKYNIPGKNTLERARIFYKDINIEVGKGISKHRYLMPLDKKMRKQILPLAQPYPKRSKQAMDGTTVTAKGQNLSDRSKQEKAS